MGLLVRWLLAENAFGIPRLAVIITGIGLLVLVDWIWSDMEASDDAANRTIGTLEERTVRQAEVIRNVEEAHVIREAVRTEIDRGPGCELYARCLRASTAATADNCRRFLPAGAAPDGADCPR